MTNEAPRTLFLAVPGTQETRELDVESVRSAVARGEITLDNWAWSAARNEWVPLSHLPEFAPPAAPIAPALPVAPAVVEPVKIVRVEPKAAVKVSAQPARAAVAAPVPSATGTGRKTGHAATFYSKPMQEHHEFPIFKILFVVLGLLIAALIVVNYFLVDQPYTQKFSKTPFAKVTTYAHLAAFVQPGVLLIHVVPSKEITTDNFADLLTALTQSAPHEALAGHEFSTISLTSAWLGQYAIQADDWKGFADMGGLSPDEKREYVLSHLQRISGAPLYEPGRNETPEKNKQRQEKIWQELVANFQPK